MATPAPTSQRAPSKGAAARITVTSVSPGTPSQAAGWIRTSPTGPGIAHTLPQGFHGKPVPMNWRARSASVHSPPNNSARCHPGNASRAPAHGTAMNTASRADRAGTASGTSHQ